MLCLDSGRCVPIWRCAQGPGPDLRRVLDQLQDGNAQAVHCLGDAKGCRSNLAMAEGLKLPSPNEADPSTFPGFPRLLRRFISSFYFLFHPSLRVLGIAVFQCLERGLKRRDGPGLKPRASRRSYTGFALVREENRTRADCRPKATLASSDTGRADPWLDLACRQQCWSTIGSDPCPGVARHIAVAASTQTRAPRRTRPHRRPDFSKPAKARRTDAQQPVTVRPSPLGRQRIHRVGLSNAEQREVDRDPGPHWPDVVRPRQVRVGPRGSSAYAAAPAAVVMRPPVVAVGPFY